MAEQLNLNTSYNTVTRAVQGSMSGGAPKGGSNQAWIDFANEGLDAYIKYAQADEKSRERRKKEQEKIAKEQEIKKDAAARVLYDTNENKSFDQMQASLQKTFLANNPAEDIGNLPPSLRGQEQSFEIADARAKKAVEVTTGGLRKNYNQIFAEDLRSEEQAYIDTNGKQIIRNLYEQYQSDPAMQNPETTIPWMDYAGLHTAELQSQRAEILHRSSPEMKHILSKKPLNYKPYNEEVGVIFKEIVDNKQNSAIQHRLKLQLKNLRPNTGEGVSQIIRTVSGNLKSQHGTPGLFSNKKIENSLLGILTSEVQAADSTSSPAFQYMKSGLYKGGSGESLFNRKDGQGKKWATLANETIAKYNSLSEAELKIAKRERAKEKRNAEIKYHGQEVNFRSSLLKDKSPKNVTRIVNLINGLYFREIIKNSPESADEFRALTKDLEAKQGEIGAITDEDRKKVKELSPSLVKAGTKSELSTAFGELIKGVASPHVIAELNKIYEQQAKAIDNKNPASDPEIQERSKFAKRKLKSETENLTAKQTQELKDYLLFDKEPSYTHATRSPGFSIYSDLQDKEKGELIDELDKVINDKRTEVEVAQQKAVQKKAFGIYTSVLLGQNNNLGKTDKEMFSLDLYSTTEGREIFSKYLSETKGKRKEGPKWESVQKVAKVKEFILQNPGKSAMIDRMTQEIYGSKTIGIAEKIDLKEFQLGRVKANEVENRELKKEKLKEIKVDLTNAKKMSIFGITTLDQLNKEETKITAEEYGQEGANAITTLIGNRKDRLRKKKNLKADRAIQTEVFKKVDELRDQLGGKKKWDKNTTKGLRDYLKKAKFSGDDNGIQEKLFSLVNRLSDDGANAQVVFEELEKIKNAQSKVAEYHGETEKVIEKIHRGELTFTEGAAAISTINETYDGDLDFQKAIEAPEEATPWETIKSEERRRLTPYIDKDFRLKEKQRIEELHQTAEVKRKKRAAIIIQDAQRIIEDKNATQDQVSNALKSLTDTNPDYISKMGTKLPKSLYLQESTIEKYSGLLLAKAQKIKYGDSPNWETTPDNMFKWHNEVLPFLREGMTIGGPPSFAREKNIVGAIKEAKNRLNQMFSVDKALHPNDYDRWMKKAESFNKEVLDKIDPGKHGIEYINSKFFTAEGFTAKVRVFTSQYVDDGKALRGEIINAFRKHIQTTPVKTELEGLEYPERLQKIEAIVDSFFLYGVNEENMSGIPGIKEKLETYNSSWRELLKKRKR